MKVLAASILGLTLMTPMAHADIMATIAMKAAQSYAEKAIKDPVMQSKIMTMATNDPGFKDRIVLGIKNAIANPKFAPYREKAIAFLSKVEQK